MSSIDQIAELIEEQTKLYMQNCVVRSWVYLNCSFKQQTVLLCSLRGCDTTSKEDLSKSLTRKLRAAILHSADPENSLFMKGDNNKIKQFLEDLDHYPIHWLMHCLHSCEIIGYKCDDGSVRHSFNSLYLDLVNTLHLCSETEEGMDKRLSDSISKPELVRTVPSSGYHG